MSLGPILATHRVVACVGSGGVGKTTTAAALAARAAAEGRSVLCLTIDPARRLAQSLGLPEIRGTEQAVSRELFAAAGLECKGALSVMMLDPKGTFDALVARRASSPAARDRILSNRIYQHVSSSLAGVQEYMAMEKLHEVRARSEIDLVILDTPPTSHALDFLDAPERLIGLIDSPATRWFMSAFEEGRGKLSFDLVGKSAAYLLRGLAKFTGAEFLDAVAEFVIGLNELFGGFRARAVEVLGSLRGDDVAFVVVTSPSPLAVDEALFVHERLGRAQMHPKAFVVNGMRTLLAEPGSPRAELVAEIAALGRAGLDAARFVDRARRALDDERTLAVADRIEAERLRTRAGSGALLVEVPALEEDVHDLRGLSTIASYLVGDARP